MADASALTWANTSMQPNKHCTETHWIWNESPSPLTLNLSLPQAQVIKCSAGLRNTVWGHTKCHTFAKSQAAIPPFLSADTTMLSLQGWNSRAVTRLECSLRIAAETCGWEGRARAHSPMTRLSRATDSDEGSPKPCKGKRLAKPLHASLLGSTNCCAVSELKLWCSMECSSNRAYTVRDGQAAL